MGHEYLSHALIELMHWELKSGLGLGEHQVSGDKNRSEKSVGIAVLAYLAAPAKYEAESATSETCRWVALDGPSAPGVYAGITAGDW